MYDENMTPQEQAVHPDWFVRCYGPQLANAAEKMRRELDEAGRWTWKDRVKAVWNWVIFISVNASIIYIVTTLIAHLKSC